MVAGIKGFFSSVLTLVFAAVATGCVNTNEITWSGLTGSKSTTGAASAPLLAAPVYVGATPASPSSAASPLIWGTTASGTTTVDLYSDTCVTSIGSGTAATFGGAGIPAGVTANNVTTIYARGSDGINFSPCVLLISYTHDNLGPTVVDVTSPTADATYKVGDVINITVRFSEVVTVSGGTPNLALNSSGNANYVSGSGSDTLTLQYTVGVGNTTADLNYVAAGSLAAGGATIVDAANNAANLLLPATGAANALGPQKAIVVDGIVPTVTGVTAAEANALYGLGATLTIQVNFSEAVIVAGGTPGILLETGAVDRLATYVSGSGTSTLNFSYNVTAGDLTADLDFTSSTALSGNLAGATITDLAGNNASSTLTAPGAAGSLGANKAIAVDGNVPTVTSVTASEVNGTYIIGSTITIQVFFSENITVTGTPQISLNTGATINHGASCGGNCAQFSYTIASGESAADLDYASTSALVLNGGTIRDGANNNANLTLTTPGAVTSLGFNKNIVVDGVIPVVTSVSPVTAGGTYSTADQIDFEVNFDQAVVVTGGPPILALNVGASATYISGSGTSALRFRYTVTAGQNSADLNYTSTASLNPSGATIRDLNNNTANLTLPAVAGGSSLAALASYVINTNVAILTFNPGTPFNYSNVKIGQTVDQPFTVENTTPFAAGSVSGSVGGGNFSFKGGTYPGVGGDCPTGTLPALTSCTVVLRFTPTLPHALKSDGVDISYNDGVYVKHAIQSIQGFAYDAAKLVINTNTTYDYGSRLRGTETTQILNVENVSGTIGATGVAGPALPTGYYFRGGSYPGTSGTCSPNIGFGVTCTIDVAFKPTMAGTQNGSVTLNYNDGLGATNSSLPLLGSGNGKAAFVTSQCIRAVASGEGFLDATACGFNAHNRRDIRNISGNAWSADNMCQQLAANAGLTNSGNFIAWASSSGLDAYCRVQNLLGTRAGLCGQGTLPTTGGPWYLVQSGGNIDPALPLATGITQLTSCNPLQGNNTANAPCLLNMLRNNELGESHSGYAHTDTYADGSFAASGCAWNFGGGCMTGLSDQTDSDWSAMWYGGWSDTYRDRHLYCFEK